MPGLTRAVLLVLAACSESNTAATPAEAVVKCSVEPSVRCDCDTRDSPSGTDVACSRASLGEPSLCCSDEPFAKEKNGGCSCIAFTCERVGSDGGTSCRCGPVSATNAQRVPSCAAATGEQCCVDAKKQLCTCSAASCDGTVVPDCSIDRVEKTCEAQFTTYRSAVSSCRD